MSFNLNYTQDNTNMSNAKKTIKMRSCEVRLKRSMTDQATATQYTVVITEDNTPIAKPKARMKITGPDSCRKVSTSSDTDKKTQSQIITAEQKSKVAANKVRANQSKDVKTSAKQVPLEDTKVGKDLGAED